MLKNLEIEFKYNAKHLNLTHFKAFCEASHPRQFQIISGYDHFFSKHDDPDSFYRHRVNTNENQLTFKRKTVKDNSYVREEHNIDLPLNVSADKIRDLCNISSYKYNTSIFKNCFIYNYEYYTLVFYICYDKDLKELDRFLEIEMREDYDWSTEEEALSALKTIEKLCAHTLLIGPGNRINQSLFEMFRKEEHV